MAKRKPYQALHICITSVANDKWGMGFGTWVRHRAEFLADVEEGIALEQPKLVMTSGDFLSSLTTYTLLFTTRITNDSYIEIKMSLDLTSLDYLHLV